ncbi:DMT family transporter [Pseudoduganella lutea]|nr:DMT family transporter [Pseudoduganella lutea]
MLTKTALLAIIPTGIALLAGAALPLQAASDAAIGLEPGHPLSGALVWLAVGIIITLAVALLLRVPGAQRRGD